MKKPSSEKEEMVKTSLRLPRGLWRAAHIRALDEHRDLQDVVADALALYLRSPIRGGAAR